MGEADERACPKCKREYIISNYTLDFACDCGYIIRPKFAERED